jgi:hypothetical protein
MDGANAIVWRAFVPFTAIPYEASQMRIDNVANSVTTTDATPTPLVAFSIPPATAGVFLVMVTARNTSTNKSANFIGGFGAQNLTGTAAVLGTQATLLSVANGSDPSMTGVAVTCAASGGSVLVKGTGIAATTIQWQASVSLLGAD